MNLWVFFDFDGVFTDNQVYVGEDGYEFVNCSREDGIGLALLKELRINVRIISTESNGVVASRAKKLGIPYSDNVENKLEEIKKFCPDISNAIFVGNDINDLEVMKAVDFPIAVCDADERILAIAEMVTKKKGGQGAVREVCEQVACMLYSGDVDKNELWKKFGGMEEDDE